jgi:hypothetical protein
VSIRFGCASTRCRPVRRHNGQAEHGAAGNAAADPQACVPLLPSTSANPAGSPVAPPPAVEREAAEAAWSGIGGMKPGPATSSSVRMIRRAGREAVERRIPGGDRPWSFDLSASWGEPICRVGVAPRMRAV